MGVYYYRYSIARNDPVLQVLVDDLVVQARKRYTTDLLSMKTLIISDLHLSHRFDFARAEYLIDLLGSADRVILNGDFWDNHATTFDRFVHSPWKMLFPILKSRHTIYLYGNHDRPQDSDERVALFSDIQANHWQLHDGKLHLHIEHGHQLLAKHHDSPDWIVTLFRVSLYDVWFRTPLERLLVTKNSMFLHRWHMGESQAELITKSAAFTDELLVTGHTHLPIFDAQHEFVNMGYINHGLSYYVWVENGQGFFIKEQYLPKRTLLAKENLLSSMKVDRLSKKPQ